MLKYWTLADVDSVTGQTLQTVKPDSQILAGSIETPAPFRKVFVLSGTSVLLCLQENLRFCKITSSQVLTLIIKDDF